jgi:hypothetical protein
MIENWLATITTTFFHDLITNHFHGSSTDPTGEQLVVDVFTKTNNANFIVRLVCAALLLSLLPLNDFDCLLAGLFVQVVLQQSEDDGTVMDVRTMDTGNIPMRYWNLSCFQRMLQYKTHNQTAVVVVVVVVVEPMLMVCIIATGSVGPENTEALAHAKRALELLSTLMRQ